MLPLAVTKLSITRSPPKDQAKVNAAGGFPYRITQPGSYRLAGNLVAPLGKTGIDVSAGGSVSLDLNGFSISSAASCDQHHAVDGPRGPGCGQDEGAGRAGRPWPPRPHREGPACRARPRA